MEKIFFAINHQQVEEAIKKSLEDIDGFDFEVVFAAVHKEQVVNEIMNKRPSILILEEGLQGKVDVFTLVEKISQRLPNTRIIFLAGDRKVGDPKLAKLVAYHIYDIVLGGTVSVSEIVNLIVNPTPYSEVTKFLNTKDEIFGNEDLLGDDTDSKNNADDAKQTSTTILIKGDVIEGEENTPSQKKNIPGLSGLGALISKFPKKDKNPNVDEPEYPSAGPVAPDIPLTAPGPGAPTTMPPQMQPQYPGQNVLPQYPPQNPYQQPYQYPPQYMPPQQGWVPNQQYPPMGGYMPQGQDNLYQPIPQNPQNDDSRKNDKGGLWGKRMDRGRLVNAKQQLITFYSPKGGIGTTTAALNAAVEGANRNQRVLLIEFNHYASALCYWFDFPNEGFGLEDALFGVGSQNYNGVAEAIITKQKLLKNVNSPFYDNYRALPNTLDYMFFSDAYLRKNNKTIISTNILQDFLYFCLYQLNYDEVYIDIAASTERELAEQCLIISGKNVILISQDIAIINNVVTFFKEFNKRGLNFDIGYTDSDDRPENVSEKNIYIINKYASANNTFNDAKILRWIKCRNVCTIPEAGAEVNSLLAQGYIPVLYTKSRQFRDSFRHLGNLIEA